MISKTKQDLTFFFLDIASLNESNYDEKMERFKKIARNKKHFFKTSNSICVGPETNLEIFDLIGYFHRGAPERFVKKFLIEAFTIFKEELSAIKDVSKKALLHCYACEHNIQGAIIISIVTEDASLLDEARMRDFYSILYQLEDANIKNTSFQQKINKTKKKYFTGAAKKRVSMRVEMLKELFNDAPLSVQENCLDEMEQLIQKLQKGTFNEKVRAMR